MTTTTPLKAHVWEREEHEHYVEPEWTSARLFEVENFEGEIYDPFCGFGRVPESARAIGHTRILASDIVDRGYRPSFVTDFRKSGVITDNYVSNPPFGIFQEVTLHALKLARRKVAMLWLTRRLPAAKWLLDTPLTRVWLLTPRPSMPPGCVISHGVGLDGKPRKVGGGTQEFCWLVWDKSRLGGRVELKWLHRDGQPEW